MDKFYTSRSSIESYQRCPRYRYLHDYYNGTGIVPTSRSVPLTTGTCIHLGVEHLLKRAKISQSVGSNYVISEEVDVACQLAINEYINLVEKAGFYGKGDTLTQQQLYTFQEQKALTEGLIRVWAFMELPLLLERFNIVAVERELVALLPETYHRVRHRRRASPVIYLQARVDAELQDKQDGSYYNYSLKTTKQWDERSEKSYKHDLQGLTEIWVTEQQTEIVNESLQRCNDNLDDIYRILGESKFLDIRTYLEKKRQKAKKIMGVKFCFLIKGRFEAKEKNNPDSVYHTNSPLVRGYRNISPTEVNYSSSLYYRNPENRSGWGRLGKGWEEFDVWSDSNWGVKRWVNWLLENDRESLKERCVTPPEYFRDEKEIEEAIWDIRGQETYVCHGLNDLDEYPLIEREKIANGYFPRYRGSCHYPTDCEYNSICWPGSISGIPDGVEKDPIASGLFQIRVPHHKYEMEERSNKINATDIITRKE